MEIVFFVLFELNSEYFRVVGVGCTIIHDPSSQNKCYYSRVSNGFIQKKREPFQIRNISSTFHNQPLRHFSLASLSLHYRLFNISIESLPPKSRLILCKQSLHNNGQSMQSTALRLHDWCAAKTSHRSGGGFYVCNGRGANLTPAIKCAPFVSMSLFLTVLYEKNANKNKHEKSTNLLASDVRRREKIVIYLFTLSRTFDDVTWNSVLSPGPPLCPPAFCSLGRLFFLGVFIVVGQSRRGIWPQPPAPPDRKSSVQRASAKIGRLLCDRWHWHPPTYYRRRFRSE